MDRTETESNQIVAEEIGVRVNGSPRRVPAHLTVARLMEHFGIDAQRVAVELNREIVRKPAWESTEVGEGADLEIVQFVGGG